MEKGYYIPEIEEFHVGFQCEFFNNMTTKKWVKEICDVDLVCMAYDIHEHGCKEDDDAFEDTFRALYLDKADIESLNIKDYNIILNKGFVDIWRKHDSYPIIRNINLKNKSELIVFLKQTGIIKE